MANNDFPVYPICHYCGRAVVDGKMHRNQRVHTSCALANGPDLVINCGTFHAEVCTELMTKKQLTRWLRAVQTLWKPPKGSIQRKKTTKPKA